MKPGWLSGFFPCLSPLWTSVLIPPQTEVLDVDWVFRPYLIALVFPTGVFLPHPKLNITQFLCPIHPAIGANCAVGKINKSRLTYKIK